MTDTYKLFTTATCHKCPLMKEHLGSLEIVGDFIDASTPEGLDIARKFNVNAVPLVVFLDKEGNETARATEISEVNSILNL